MFSPRVCLLVALVSAACQQTGGEGADAGARGGAGGASRSGVAGSSGTSGAPGVAGAGGSPRDAPADIAPGQAPTADGPGVGDLDAPAAPDARPSDLVPAAERLVTFLAFGDPQYGGGPGDKNSFHIQALNAAPDLRWPAGFTRAGEPVGEPRAVIIAGDLTQNGQAGRNPLGEWYTGDAYAFDLNKEYGLDLSRPRISAELGLFLRDYGLRGNDGRNAFVLRWRVFEGYGNHDFDVLERNSALYSSEAPARDIVSLRNRVRGQWPEIRRQAPRNAGHYSWDWDDVHFVQLNLAGADGATAATQQPRDPLGALAFLMEDLAAEVGTSCRPVVLIKHYGFDPFSSEDRWWDAGQRRAFLRALRSYNVIAILHGHVHETRAYEVEDEGGRAYDVFSLGSPYYGGQPTNGGRGHFAVFRIDGTSLEAADASWQPANPVPEMANGRDLWTGKRLADVRFQTTTTFPDGWGGWSFRKTIDPRRCPSP